MTDFQKLLKLFVYGSLVIYVVGFVALLADNDLDIYTVWAMAVFLSSAYLINILEKK